MAVLNTQMVQLSNLPIHVARPCRSACAYGTPSCTCSSSCPVGKKRFLCHMYSYIKLHGMRLRRTKTAKLFCLAILPKSTMGRFASAHRQRRGVDAKSGLQKTQQPFARALQLCFQPQGAAKRWWPMGSL